MFRSLLAGTPVSSSSVSTRWGQKLAVLAIFTLGSLCAPLAQAATYTVTTTADTIDAGDGRTSFREALTDANANPGLDTINFNIDNAQFGAPPHVINVTTQLPAITSPVLIDGLSEPDLGGVSPIGNPTNDDLAIQINASGSVTFGFQISNGADGTTIRGLSITGFGGGGAISFRVPTTIVSNYIGVAANGTTAAGNSYGVLSSFPGTAGSVLGGTNPSDGNVIAHSSNVGIAIGNTAGAITVRGNIIRDNGTEGIRCTGTGTGYRLQENRIYGNGSLGIELGSDGVTPNDTSDSDSGPNNWQNFPVVTAAETGTSTKVAGSLTTQAGTYTVEFFSSQSSTNGQGQQYLGRLSNFVVATTGVAQTFNVSNLAAATVGHYVTATAISESDTATSDIGDTSEFSAPVAIVATETPSLVVTIPGDSSTSTDNQTSLREAIAYANSFTDNQLHTITFSNSTANGATNFHDGTTRTITLGGSELSISTAVTIDGPGADRLSISGNNTSRLFEITPLGTARLNGLTLTGGNGVGAVQSANGGAIVNRGTLMVFRCVITGNSASVSGGAICAREGSSTPIITYVIDSLISSNTANTGGAAFLNYGYTYFINSTVANNSGPSGGGVLANGGSVFAINSTFSGNIGGPSGGGVGGIYASNQFQSRNTVIAGNTGQYPDIVAGGAAYDSLGYNLIGNTTGSNLPAAATGDLRNVAANLGTLGNYGGTTSTVPLLSGSPAINAGSATVSEIQSFTVRGNSGTFTLTVDGQTTGALAYNASVADVKTALENLSTVGTGNVDVNYAVGTFTLHYRYGARAETNVGDLTASGFGTTVLTRIILQGGNITTDQRGKLRPQFGSVDMGAFEQTPVDAGQTIVTTGGASWYLGPTAVGSDLRVYREVSGQVATWVDNGTASQIGVTDDGTLLIQKANGEVYQRVGSSAGSGTSWQQLATVAAADGAKWFLGPYGPGGNFTIYRWGTNGSLASSGGGGSWIAASGGLILTRNNANLAYVRNGSNSGLGTAWAQITESLVVTTPTDEDDGVANPSYGTGTSLREALAYAARLSGSQTITFSNTTAGGATNFHDGTARTITLNGTQLVINHAVTITGPGANKLAISGNNVSRVFNVGAFTVSMSGLTVMNGRQAVSNDVRGGGIYSAGTLSLTDCVIRNNHAISPDNSPTMGGGIHSVIGVTLTLTRCAVLNNTTSGPNQNTGGGIYCDDNGTLNLYNCTFSGNAASGGLNYGGGIQLFNSTASKIVNCTISGNTGDWGGGIYALTTQPVLINSILSGNSGYPAYANLAGDLHASSSNNLLNGSADLAPLGDYGGPTPTMPPLASSPAIDAGSNALALGGNNQPLTTDQRGPGFPRITKGKLATASPTVDIGAAEFVPGPVIYWTNANANSIGRANLDGTGVNQNFITGVNNPRGVASDRNYIYWVSTTGGSIGRANLDGTGVNHNFITGAFNPNGVVVDSGYIYWCNDNSAASQIGRANLDGTGVNQSFISGIARPRHLTVDRHFIYWGSSTSPSPIGRANLDGTGVIQNFVVAPDLVSGVAVNADYLYWANTASSDGTTLGRANLDGSSPNQSFITGASAPRGLAVDSSFIYWSQGGTICRANLDGTNANHSFITGGSLAMDVAVGPGFSVPTFPGTLAFSAAAFSVQENAGSVPITVNRTGGVDGTVTVTYTLSGGTATGGAAASAGIDYYNTGGIITFAQGETTKTFNVPIYDDGAYEGNETFYLTLSNVTGGASLGTTSATMVTILDNAPHVTSSTAALTANTTTLTINGTGFDPIAANNTVVFSNGAVGTVTQATATTLTITFTTLPTSFGNLTVVVTTNGINSGPPVQVATAVEASSLVVTTTSDSSTSMDSQTSLREAIAYAATLTGDQTITFSNTAASGVVNFHDGAAHVINLLTEQLTVASNLTIEGPGADLLTVQRSTMGGTPNFRVFEIESGVTATLAGLTIANGKLDSTAPGANRGGGIYTSGTLWIDRCTVSGNTCGATVNSQASGGGIYSVGTLLITHSTISGNTAGGTANNTPEGGGIYSNGDLTLIESTVSENSVTSNRSGTSVFGGGIQSAGGTLTVIGSTLSGNSLTLFNSSSQLEGGAIRVANPLLCINSTISGNLTTSTTGSRTGAGIFFGSSHPALVLNTTITGNVATRGPAIYLNAVVPPGVIKIHNSIIAGNLGGTFDPEASGDFGSLGGNLIGNTTGSTGWIANDLQNVDPKLGPLQNNGGPTFTHALLPDSPAIDAGLDTTTLTSAIDAFTQTIVVGTAGLFYEGDVLQIGSERMIVLTVTANTLGVTRGAFGTTAAAHAGGAGVNPAFDQRGEDFPRLIGSRIDIGAVEAILFTPSISAATTNEDTTTSSGLVISANANDNGESTHFKITGITGGTLFQNNGTTQIQDGDFITLAQGTAGLKFTPTANFNNDNTQTDFGFSAQAAIGNTDTALQGDVTDVAITVNPVNDAPTLNTISNPASILVNSGQQTINLAGISSGPEEKQALTITAVSNNHSLIPDPTVTYQYADTTGSLNYTPVAGAIGTALITVTVSDGQSANATFTRTFTVTVSPIPANDDIAFTSGKKAITIDVLANDTGIPGTVALSIGTAPQHGTATIVNGKVRYTPRGTLPNSGDTFTYHYDDGQGGTGTATVTVVNFLQIAGVYDGLVQAVSTGTALERHEQSGFLRVTVSKSGSFSGVLTLAGTKLSPIVRIGFTGYGFNSKLGTVGEAVKIILRRPRAPVTMTLQLDPATRTIEGTIASIDSGGQAFTSPLALAPQAPAGATAGAYTMLVQPDSTPGSPQGSGYAVATISPIGAVSVRGRLADGTTFSSNSYFHSDQSFALYAPLYRGTYPQRGSLRGIMTFASGLPMGEATGDLAWFKPLRPKDAYYPNSLDLERAAILGRYEKPAIGTPILDFDPVADNGLATLNLGGSDTNQLFTLRPSNLVTLGVPNPLKLTLSFNRLNGLFSGSFTNPANQRRTSFSGAVFQQTTSGAGYFLDTSVREGSSIDLRKQPPVP